MKKKKLYLYFSIGFLILFTIYIGDFIYNQSQDEKPKTFSFVIKLLFSTSQAFLFYQLYKMEVKKETANKI